MINYDYRKIVKKQVVMLGFCLNRLRFLEVVVSKKIDQL